MNELSSLFLGIKLIFFFAACMVLVVIAVTVCFVVFKLLLKIFDIVDFYI